MKKSILVCVMAFFAIAANAQTVTVKESEVAPAAKATLVKLHPNANVTKWEHVGINWEAEFTENGVETSVNLGPNGQLLDTEVEIKVSELPKTVSDYCTTNMPGKKIAEASKITDAKGMISYEAEVDGTDYIFDGNGTFLKKEVEAKDTDKK